MQKEIRVAKLVFTVSTISYKGVSGTQWLRSLVQRLLEPPKCW